MNDLPKWIRVFSDGRISYYPGKVVGKGQKRVVVRGGKTRAEAMPRAIQIVAEVEIGASLKIDHDATWATLFIHWERHHVSRIPEGTYRTRMSAINRRLLPVIGDVRLINTNRSTLTAVIDAAVESGNGASSFETELQTLNVVARWAEERMWLPENPFGSPSKVTSTIRAGKKLVLSGAGGRAEEVRLKDVPTWDDVVTLAHAVETTTRRLIGDEALALRYAAAVRVAAGSGLRLCELLALTVADIDLNSGTISVTKQLNRYLPWDDGAPMPVLPPKYDSTREVRVWRRIADDLEFLVTSAGPDGVLIPPRSPGKSWADGWSNLLKAARESIGWKWTPHYLRHHYGSYSTAPVADGGFAQAYPAVQKWMGHRRLKTTLETYVHDLSSDQGWIG
jgi:integrase